MPDTATMHIDGAARGNPGPAAYAVVLARPGLPITEEAETLGKATNNVAEYTALVRGLELAAELGVRRLKVFSDSELLVKQMAGEYRVKSDDLRELYDEACRLRRGFDAVSITHVRREQNKRADALCNEALDGKRGKVPNPSPGPSPTRGGESSNTRGSPPSPAGKGAGGLGLVGDSAVRPDALDVLRSAARAWADGGPGAVPVEAVWEQLWSVLEDGGVLRKPKAK